MNILITGGNGYIARSLYEALKEEHYVARITRSDFDLSNYNDTSNYFKNKYFDFIIHTAADGGSRLKEETWGTMDKNLSMYYNLLQNKKSFGKLIHFGSGAEVHSTHTPYGFSKKVIANSIQDQAGFYNIRIFAVFDENELETRFIKANLRRYVNHQPMEIYQNKFMDFFYMKDLVKLVKYYLSNDDAPKQIDCSYNTLMDLVGLAQFINILDTHEVDIIIKEEGFGNDYFGEYKNLGIEYTGLKNAIIDVYNKLSNEKNKLSN